MRTDRRRIPGPLALGLTAVLVLSACGTGDGTAGGAGDDGTGGGTGDPVAVATTTQLGSLVSEITGCAGAGSATVMGPGDDPHDFSASSQQVAQMASAELVVANGLGLEMGLRSALDNAAADGATVVEVAPELDPLPLSAVDHHGHSHDDGHEHGHDHGADGHDHGELDPHVWMDVGRMATAAGLIGERLAEQTGNDRYAACGEQAAASLEQTDEQVRQILAEIPADRRTLVTDHAAYNYFADAYDFEVSGVVIPGGSTDAEPSSQELAALVHQIDDAGADAILTSAGSGDRLVGTIAAETAEQVPVVELYESGVGPEGSGAQTYAGAMVHNAQALAEALR